MRFASQAFQKSSLPCPGLAGKKNMAGSAVDKLQGRGHHCRLLFGRLFVGCFLIWEIHGGDVHSKIKFKHICCKARDNDKLHRYTFKI